MRALFSFLGLCSITLSTVVSGSPLRSPDAQRATRQFREFYLGPADAFAMRDNNEIPPDPARASAYARALHKDGTWSDIDYASSARSGWPPAVHYTRMASMATTAERPGASDADRTLLLQATHRAFAYWIAHDFQCPNWWYNEIGTPKTIGTCALLLGDDLEPAEYDYVTRTLLPRYPIARTGQNKVWLAGNALMLGLLTGEVKIVREASDAIWSEVRITTDEGIQPDFSFHQHGHQQQFGNYGMAFAVETARWAGILRETPWQLPAENLRVFRDYLLKGENWVSWRGAMDISACGRQFMPHSPISKTENLARVMAQAAVFDPGYAADYHAFIARNHPGAPNDLVGDTYFWRSDYLIHRRPNWTATLKMSSHRVIGAELVNSENLSGYHIGDGALYLYRDSGEYADIFPVWDWRKIPGVTCAQTQVPDFKTSSVPTDFVGGISDGRFGCAALDYRRDGVTAKKAWFFADDVVVCLGADLSGPKTAVLVTTLNQCLRRGPIRVHSASGWTTTAAGSRALDAIDAVEHGGWAYTLLETAALRLESGPAAGNWHRVFNNPDSPKADVTKDVFTLWIDHGAEATRARYAYAIGPTGTEVAPRVLANSPALQAVRLADDRVALVFWSAGEARLPDGRTVGVDEPALLLVSGNSLQVVDPTEKLTAIQVRLANETRTLPLPSGPRAGTAAAWN